AQPPPATEPAAAEGPSLKQEVTGTVDRVVVLLDDVVNNLGTTVNGILGGPPGR
ncbi:MAG: hypothetical protein QOI73_1613, partial [Solirubrobacteraceae bacterium]|nr:hypothetical protein [Solirubrobacteraceae bacterium]